MNDSTDNTNELDSYGVWVKHQPSGDAENVQPDIAESTESLDIDDAFDLPDFPESGDTIDAINTDFDIPVEETLDIEDETSESSSEENIEIPTEDSLDLPDFPSEDEIEMPEMPSEEEIEFPTEESIEIPTEESIEIPTEESIEVPSEEDIEMPEMGAEENVEIDTSDFELPTEDGEISLDDFGFDDSSSGGSDDFQLPTEDGEISLDDFGFDDSGSSGKTDEIVDEKPLDMDISFDSSAETVETVDNVQTDDEEEEVTEEEYAKQIEESGDYETHSTEVSGSTEEIDLSDFGIDADAEETPITQNVEESKLKDRVVDYDLAVSDENMASAPVVNEIRESASADAPDAPAPVDADPNTTAVNNSLLEQIVADLSGLKNEISNLKANLEEMKSQENAPASEEPIIPEDSAEESGGFFDDTDGDDTIALSGNELDNIMNSAEFSEEIPEGDSPSNGSDEDFAFADTPAETDSFGDTETEAVEDTEIEIPDSSDEGGFFDNDDTDDTIALSGNELDNIMNNVEFSEETVVEESPVEEPAEEPAMEEPVLAEEELDDIPQEIDIEPAQTDVIDDDIFGAVDSVDSDEADFIDDTNSFEESETVEENEEALEEPNLDDIVISNDEEDELPDEISIPKVDDILVESSNDDFMNSVQDSTTEEPVPGEPAGEEKIDDFDDFMQAPVSDEESLTEGNIDYLSEDSDFASVDSFIDEEPTIEETAVSEDEVFTEETPAEEPSFDEEPAISEDATISEDAIADKFATENIADSIPSVDDFIFDESSSGADDTVIETPMDEPVFEETAVEEPTFDEPASAEEQVIDEPAIEESAEPTIDEPAVSPMPTPVASVASSDNTDLKQDIKSVLLYMDQLLENLPEEKIVEFAKSDEFATYKKLFNELGLS